MPKQYRICINLFFNRKIPRGEQERIAEEIDRLLNNRYGGIYDGWEMEVSESIIPEAGMKVFVLSPDREKVLGEGEIIKVEPLILEETGEVLTETYPTIRLKDGRELGGLDCWWIPKPCDEVICEECILSDYCSEVRKRERENHGK